MTSLGTTSKPADTGSAMGPEMGLEVGRRPSGCPATRPRHARTLTGHGRHKFGRFSSWPGPASRSIKLKNVLRPRLSASRPKCTEGRHATPRWNPLVSAVKASYRKRPSRSYMSRFQRVYPLQVQTPIRGRYRPLFHPTCTFHILVRPMPFEFIDRLVMVMSVAERCCGVCWPSPASVHGRFTAVKSTNRGTSR